jgi:hypothetical protein
MQTSSEQTLAEIQEANKRQAHKEKLLRSLANAKSVPSGGVPTEDALSKIRQRELNSLLESENNL